MRVLFFLFLVLTGLMIAIPPQVKAVQFTYDSTHVTLWYPTVLRIDGKLLFAGQFRVLEPTSNPWTFDTLRSASFLCGKQACNTEANPVAAAWQKVGGDLRATELDLEKFRGFLASAQQTQRSMQDYVSSNSCEVLSKGPSRPAFACSASEAQEVATTTCLIREMGAKLCEKGGKDVLPEDAPKFFRDAVAREGCGAIVHEITGERYNLLDKTIKKYTDELGITLLSELLGVFSKDLKEGFDWSVAAAKTKACIPSGMLLCRQKQSAWEEAYSLHFSKYDQPIKWCNEAKVKLDGAAQEIVSNEKYIAIGTANLSRLKGEQDRLEKLRETRSVSHFLGDL